MAPSILKVTLFGILSLITSTTLAFEDITVPWIVTADTDFKVAITNDINTTRSFDAGFTHYRIYLSTTPPGWGTGPVCVLVNSSKIDVESHTIQIPASVGPRASYKLTTMEFNEDPYADGPSGFQYSNSFDLKGGSGEWGASELNGHVIGNADDIPCTAYDCARKCNDDNYPASSDRGNKGFAAYKTAYNCVAKCPGVTVTPWSTWYSDDADSFDDERDEDSQGEDSTDEDSNDGSLSDSSTLSSTGFQTATTSSVSESLQTVSTSSLAISTSSSTATITAASGSTPTFSSSVVTPSPAAGAGSQASMPALILLAGCLGSTIAVLAL